jgi:hypothetical protein
MTMMTGDRSVMIEVSGVYSATTHQSNYKIKVPYGSMAKKIQDINRQGGKIVNVSIAGAAATPMPELSAAPATENSQKKGNKSKKK